MIFSNIFSNKNSKGMSETKCMEALKEASKLLDRQEATIKKQNDKIGKLEAHIEDMKEIIVSLRNASFTYATVVGFDKRSIGNDGETVEPMKTVKVMHAGQFAEVVNGRNLDLKEGDVVKIVSSKEGLNIVEKSEHKIEFGQTVFIKKILDVEHAEIDYNGAPRVILTAGLKLEEETRVLLDEHGIIAIKDLGKDPAKNVFKSKTNVSWADIGGQERAKEEIIEAIEGPIKNAEIYKAYGKKPTKGILLYGPPGNGKTMFGKAIATSIAEMHGSEADGFIYVKGPEILNMYVGNSEERIRALFQTAREFKNKHGHPAVLFIDESEAILSARGTGRSSDVDRTIVPQFLAEMDGLDDSAAIVVLTTNRPDMLDSAVIREGRVDKKIRIGKPDIEAVKSIFMLNLKNVPIEDTCENIIQLAATTVFDSGLVLYDLSLKSGKTRQFTYSDIINGAMISTIVNDAVGMAIKRDMAAKAKTPKGINAGLVQEAIINSFKQNVRMNHEQHLKDLSYELSLENDEIKSVQPIKAETDVRKKEAIS